MLRKISRNIIISVTLACTIFVLSQVLTLTGETQRLYVEVLVIGAGIGGLGSIYLVKKIPPVLQLGIHLGGSLLIFLLFNYFPFRESYSLARLTGLIGGFCLLFMVIWTLSYLQQQRELTKINQKIRDLYSK